MAESEIYFTVINRSLPIRSCTVSRSDLVTLFKILNDKDREAAELEVRDLQQPADFDQTRFEGAKNWIRDLFAISVLVEGENGERVSGIGEKVLEAPNLPERIGAVYFDSSSRYKTVRSSDPQNRFQLLLDFSKPVLFNISNSASEPTRNNSAVTVQGQNDTWVRAIFQQVDDFFTERNNRRSLLHQAGIYDLLLLFLGIPFAFWVTAKLSGLIRQWFSEVGALVENIAYVYAFLLALALFRIGFNYTRWAFPKVELDQPRNSAAGHRKAWGAIAASVIAAAIYDALT